MRHLILLPALLFVLASCGGESSDTSSQPAEPTTSPDSDKPPAKEPPKSAAPAIDPEKTGTITGNVKLEGKAPRVPSFSPGGDPKCAALHTGRIKAQNLVMDGDNNVKYALVHVTAGLPEMKHTPPSTPVVLDQKGCMYEPHVFGVMVGQPILFRNSDPTLHNVHGLPFNNREWNFAQQPGQEDQRKMTANEIPLKIKCDIHPWMLSWAGVFDHPFFSVTDDKGNFEIKGLPAGKYTIKVWHEELESKTAEVKVKAKESATADFSLKDQE